MHNLPSKQGGWIAMHPMALKGPWKRVYILTAGASLDLKTYLDGESAPTGAPIEMIIPSAVDIGTITAGDLSSYNTVNLIVEGEAQGIGGAANSGVGGNAIDSNNQSNLTITLEASGAIRGGGGGGGKGGTGGQGTYDYWGSEQYSFEVTYFRNPTRTSSSECVVEWGNTTKYSGFPGIVSIVTGNDSTRYQKGSLRLTSESTWGNLNEDKWYAVKQEQTAITSGGAGGAGGQAQGYNQTLAAGTVGSNGGTNAGKGGTGATGATWGIAGAQGQTGYNGNYSSGQAGIVGGAAGKAIHQMTGVTFINNGGTIDGDYS